MKIATPQTMQTRRSTTTESMSSIILPNVPTQPTNGMIRTYENQTRTFTRPYSAKTVFFYKEGDEYFSGVRVPVSKQRYRTIDSLLDELNRNIQMPFGVRRLTTPMGRTAIESVEQLEHLGKYVASSNKYCRGINLSALERLKKVPTSPSYKTKLRLSRTLGFNVMPSKQIFFVLNGKMEMYRTLLNPLRLPTMEQLLAEVSEGLQVAIFRFYTTDGLRILNVSDMISINPPKIYACTRNDRLNMQRNNFELPSIHSNKYYGGGSYKSGTETSSSTGGNNGIEKPRRFESALRRNTRKRTGAPIRRFTRTLPAINGNYNGELPTQKRTSSIPDDTDSGKANSISSRQTDNSRTEDDDLYGVGTSIIPMKMRKPPRVAGLARNKEEKRKAYSDRNKPLPPTTKNVSERALVVGEDDNDNQEVINEGIEDVSEASDEDDDHAIASTSREVHDDEEVKEDIENSEELNTTEKVEMIRHESLLNEDTDIEQDLVMTDDSRPSSSKHRRTVHHGMPDVKEDEETLKDEMEVVEDNVIENKENIQPIEEGEEKTEDIEMTEDNDEAADTAEITAEEVQVIPEEEEVVAVEDETKEVVAVADETEEVEKEEPKIEDDEGEIRRDGAATTIQSVYRGYRTRKLLKLDGEVEPIKVEEALPALVEDDDAVTERKDDEEVLIDDSSQREKKSMYTVQINTGNRWGSETEADLYVMLHGDDGTSEKILLQHENIPWLQASDPRFQRNQNDFFQIDTPSVGTINKIVLGHDEKGYGAGIFVGYVIVTENMLEGRQFFFSINKWFDSGQVDGKIERPIPVTAFYYVNSIPDENVVTEGRWEFVLHSGNKHGQGGTTSGLLIYGYGLQGSSVIRFDNDTSLNNVPSTTLVQVDFGAIGDLIKVRFELIPMGDSPNYFLEYVELRDLDTEERLVVRVGKWLEVASDRKNPQAFRELGVYRAGVEGLHVINYEGRVHVGEMNLLENDHLSGQLIGTFDSAVFPLIYNESKKEYTFKVECVDLGRVSKLKIIGNFSKQGEAIMEGLSVLQDIWDCYSPGISVADQVLVTHAYVRESSHCPYRYVLSQGKVVELEDSKPYFKTLELTAMEGLSTMYKKDKIPSGVGTWTLNVSVDGKLDKLPDIWLISGHKAHLMTLVTEEPSEIVLQVKAKELKSVDKVRIFAGQLEAAQELVVKKLRLTNSLTKQIIRFPNVDTEFGSNDIYEFSTVYPDVSPKPNITFDITVYTTSSNGSFLPVFNLIGSESDSGVRQWGPKRTLENGLDVFEIDAVSLGDPTEIEVIILGDKKSSWSFKEIIVKNSETQKIYKTSEGTISKQGDGKRFSLQQVLST
ncbi:unnamed protein product [Auanema sp. JU1783]|nr:unnamed protein product [Auanema sp. JU1783]